MGNDKIKFPVESLPNWLKDFVLEVSRENQTPLEMTFQSCISALSFATRNAWGVRTTRKYVEPLQIWTLTPAPPGERKGVMNVAWQPIRDAEHEAIEKWKKAHHEYKVVTEPKIKKLEKDVKDAIESDNDTLAKELAGKLSELVEPMRPTYIGNDMTPESMRKVLMKNHETLAIADTEATILKVLGGLYNKGKDSTNLGFVNKCYVCEPYQWSRSNGEEGRIDLPYVVFSLFIQSDIMDGWRGTDFVKTGFMQRFLFSFPDSMAGTRDMDPEPAEQQIVDNWNKRITDILAASTIIRNGNNFRTKNDLTILEFSPEAKPVHLEYKNAIEKRLEMGGDLYGEISEWANKLSGTLARIAALYAIGESAHPEHISLEHLNAAFALTEYYIEHARIAWNQFNGVKSTSRVSNIKEQLVRDWIKKHAPRRDSDNNMTKPFTASDVFRYVRNRRHSPFKSGEPGKGSDLVSETLEQMINDSENEWLQQAVEARASRGRPATKYEANIRLMNDHYGEGGE